MDVLSSLFSLAPGILAVLVVSIPWLVKRAVEACAEKAVGSIFEKRLEKYKAELSRTTMAREVMLEREMVFYDTIDAQIAELVPLVQDLGDNLTEQPFTKEKRDYLTRILKLTLEMKDVSLRYQAYVEEDIWSSFNDLVIKMQSQQPRWLDLAKIISAGDDANEEDRCDARRMCDEVLFLVALVRTRQAKYLKSISGGD